MSKKQKTKITTYSDYQTTSSPLEDNNAKRRIAASQDPLDDAEPRKKEDFLEQAAARNNMNFFQAFIQKQKDKWHMVQQELQNMTTKKEKFSYLMYYYRVSALILIVTLSVTTFAVYELATKKDCIHNCMVVNDPYNTELEENLYNEIDGALTYNKKKEEVQINMLTANITDSDVGYYGTDSGSQTIFYQLTSALIDTMVSDQDVLKWYAADDNFCDLEELLPEDLKEKVSPYFITMENYSGEEKAYAIDLSSTDVFDSTDTLFEKPAIAILANTQHVDDSIKVIEALFTE